MVVKPYKRTMVFLADLRLVCFHPISPVGAQAFYPLLLKAVSHPHHMRLHRFQVKHFR